MRLGEQQRAQPVGLNLQFGDVGAQADLGAGRLEAGAHHQDRGHDGKAEQRQCGGKDRDFLMIEVEPGRNRLGQRQIAGESGFRYQ